MFDYQMPGRLCDEIERLQEDLSTARAELERTRQDRNMAKVEARRLIGAEKASEIETLTRARDAARQRSSEHWIEVAGKLQTELAAAREEGQKWQEVLELTRKELIAAQQPKPAPRCPKCGSDNVGPMLHESNWSIDCMCGEGADGFPTLDAALDAWRGGAK